MFRSLRKFLFLIGFSIVGSAYNNAHALERVYLEFGAGGSTFINGGNLFGNAGMATFPGFGLAGQLSFGWVLQPREKVFALLLGAQWRYNSVSETATGLSAAFHAIYPYIKLEAKQKFFITLGVSPLLMTRYAAGLVGVDSITIRTGVISLLTDIGYNLRVTPAVSLQFVVGSHFVFANGAFGPLPGIDALMNFRFFIDAADDFSVEENRGPKKRKFDGWRYPFGNEKGY
jgi:hypothetical protein